MRWRLRAPPAGGVIPALLLVLLGTVLSRPSSTLAGASNVVMHVIPGFGGQARPGAWLPLVVDVQNAGPDFSGTVVVPDEALAGIGGSDQVHSVYSTPVVLGSGSHKRITLYIPAADTQGGTLEVRLLDAAGALLVSQQVTVQSLPAGTLNAGVLSDDAAVARTLNSLTVDGTTLNAVALTPRDLVPQVAALRNFDLLVLSNAPTEALQPDQITALRAWVASGGVLLVAGGPTARHTLAGLPPDLLPVYVTGTTTFPAATVLAHLGGTPSAGSPVAISTAAQRAGEVVAAVGPGGRLPLAVDARLGRGHLLYVALDLALAPISTLGPTDPLWQALLGPALAAATGQALTGAGATGVPTTGNIYGMASVLQTLPAAALPPVGLFLGLMLLYVVVLGPLNYLVLRSLRRQELSWVTIPLVAVAFCLVTFLIALRGKGSDVLLNNVAVIHLDGAASGVAHPYQAETYVGLFSPTRSDYRLAVPGAALPMILPSMSFGPSPGGATGLGDPAGLVFDQGDPTTVEFHNMSMWSLRAVVLQQQIELAGTIEAHLQLNAAGGIEGSLTNRTALPLADAALITPGTVQYLGPLAPGASQAVSLTTNAAALNAGPPLFQLYQQAPTTQGGAASVPAMAPVPRPPPGVLIPRGKAISKFVIVGANGGGFYNPNGLSAQGQLYQQVLQTVFQNGDTGSVAPIVLVAWNNTPLSPFTVNGEKPRRQDLNLLIQPLWFTLTRGPFTLPEGLLAPQLVDSDTANQPSGSGLNIASGNSATFAYTLPTHGHRVHVATFSVNYSANGGPSMIQSDSGALYDWSTHSWTSVDLSNGDLHLPHAARFVSAQGVIRLRLTAPETANLYINNIGSTVQIGLTGTVQ